MFGRVASTTTRSRWIRTAVILRWQHNHTAEHSLNMANHIVGHDKEKSVFYVRLEGDDAKAVLDYRVDRPGVLDLYHTEVPPVFRGQGIAKVLAKAAMDYVVEQDAKMILTCSYLHKYAQDNPYPQYTDRIVTG